MPFVCGLREPLLPPPVLPALDQLSSKQLSKAAQSFIRAVAAKTRGGREGVWGEVQGAESGQCGCLLPPSLRGTCPCCPQKA